MTVLGSWSWRGLVALATALTLVTAPVAHAESETAPESAPRAPLADRAAGVGGALGVMVGATAIGWYGVALVKGASVGYLAFGGAMGFLLFAGTGALLVATAVGLGAFGAYRVYRSALGDPSGFNVGSNVSRESSTNPTGTVTRPSAGGGGGAVGAGYQR